jgi:DNA-binding NtrC family response regulator
LEIFVSGMAAVLERMPVLIVEDEPFIALDLASAVESAGGLVVGPAATVREALALLQRTPVRAALLDVHVGDGEVTPVATVLAARGTPVVFYCGHGIPAELKRRCPAAPVFLKPAPVQELVHELAGLMDRH